MLLRFCWEAVINLAPIWRAQSGELFLSGGAPNLAPAGRRSGEVQSGESLADLAGLLAAGNCMAQPIWRNAQSGVELILKPSWAPAGHQLDTSWYQLGTSSVARTGRSPDRPDSRQNGPRQIGASSEARLEVPPGWPERQNGQNARTPDR